MVDDLDRRRQKSHDYQMPCDAEAKLDNAAIAQSGLAVGQADLDVMMFEEGPVERIGRLVYRLLGGEEKPSAAGIIGDPVSLPRRRNQFQQVGRQRLRGLD